MRKQRPEMVRAHGIVQKAIERGVLERGPCESEDETCAGEVQAHHDDYSKPLEVRWLCRSHHTRLHLEEREQHVL